MPFTVIAGTFKPQFGKPDGDSVRFVPDDPSPIYRLRRRGAGPKINPNNGSIQLRYEGIDTLEKSAIEPHASDATNSNIKLIGTTASNDSPRGYICSNQLGPYGRPIAFIFSGDCPYDDGSEIFLEPENLKDSVNVEQLRVGNAYPLFYDTLFHDIRDYLRETTVDAKSSGRGVWSFDKTTIGFDWNHPSKMPPIFPKLWRRIDTYSRDDTFFEEEKPFQNFRQYLKSLGEERVLIKSQNRFTGFDDLIETTNSTAKLLADPEDIIVVS